MEIELMIFLVVFWGTFILIRILSYLFHDLKNYNKNKPRKSQARTLTGFLRRKTGFDWHHIHLGFILILLTILLIIFYGLNLIVIIFFAISLSLILDQFLPLLNYGDYFSKKMFIISLIFHLIVTIFILLFCAAL